VKLNRGRPMASASREDVRTFPLAVVVTADITTRECPNWHATTIFDPLDDSVST
jgi:hypothetical protein